MPAAAAPIPLLEGLSAVVDRYDGFILDLWGVLHDGVRPYPGVVDALRRLKRGGKRTVILSNGPRRAASLVRRTAEIGIAVDLYDDLHSSGEEAWRLLRERPDPASVALGRRAFLIGPERDRDLLDGLDLEVAAGPWSAPTLTSKWSARACASSAPARSPRATRRWVGRCATSASRTRRSTRPALRASARSRDRASWRSAIRCARMWRVRPASVSTPCWCWAAFMPRNWPARPIRARIPPDWPPLAPRPGNGRHMQFPLSPGSGARPVGFAGAFRHPRRRQHRRCCGDGRQDTR